MLKTIVIAAVALVSGTLSAQERRWPAAELRPFAGAFIPLGAMQADFNSATMIGTQVAVELNKHIHGVASVGWTHGHNQFLTTDLTYIWQYDVGAELNAARAMDSGWNFRPFVGVGAGGRTYDYRDAAAQTTHCTAGYGALGTELQRTGLAFRAELRDYLSCFESPVTGEKQTRNDIGLTMGVAYHFR